MDVASRSLRAITRHPAIDTEPAWAPDGRSLVFTSDRGGSPQIYRVSASGGEPQRVTFEGKYNARASYSSDGKRLTMVTRDGGEFRIGVLDLATKAFRTVSDGSLDESPSFAPNGSMIIYAARAQGRGVLFAVSAEGRTRQRLALDGGDVREPVWSPYSKR
jgi:TolB protein